MMTVKLQIVVGLAILFILAILINMIRRRSLELKYALAWFVVGSIVLIFDIFPQLLSWLADLMGVGIPVNMLFFMGFVFSLLIIFSLSFSVSRLSGKVKRMAQEIALLKEELDKKKE